MIHTESSLLFKTDTKRSTNAIEIALIVFGGWPIVFDDVEPQLDSSDQIGWAFGPYAHDELWCIPCARHESKPN